jgi:hypothetical protein
MQTGKDDEACRMSRMLFLLLIDAEAVLEDKYRPRYTSSWRNFNLKRKERRKNERDTTKS